MISIRKVTTRHPTFESSLNISSVELKDELYFKEGRFCNDPKCHSNLNLYLASRKLPSIVVSLAVCSLVEIPGALSKVKCGEFSINLASIFE